METLKKSILKSAVGFLTAALFLSAPHAAAKTSSKLPSFVRVLSYNEVMRLPKAKRQAYVRGLRAMMRELDRVPKKLRVSNDQDQRSQIALLLSLFAGDEAYAASPGVPFATPQGLKCGAGYATRMVQKQVAGVNIEAKAVCLVGSRQDRKCGSGTIGIRAQPDGTWECATLSSFNLLPDNKRSILRRIPTQGEFLLTPLLGIGGAKNNFLNNQPTAEDYAKRWEAAHPPQLKIVVAPPAKPAPAAPNAAAPNTAAALANDQGGTLAQVEERSRLARERLAATGHFPPASLAGANTSAEARRPKARAPNTPRAGAAATTAAAAAPPAARPANSREQTNYQAVDNDGGDAIVVSPVGSSSDRLSADTGPEVSDEAEGDSTQASATFGSCEPEAAKTCDASSIERARRSYASDPDPDCIYAGSVSTYQDGKKRAYKCVAPTQFCFGSNTCTNSTGERLQADYSCESDQVICNPLLFGVHSDGKSPFCIEKTAQATATCDEESKSDDGAVTPLDQDHAGLKEAWNDFADRLFKMCHKNEIAEALHCAECDIISKRLFALNVAARDVESCGAAIKFQDSQCDADGKCQGLPGQKNGSGSGSGARSSGVRAVSEADANAPAEGDFVTEVAHTKRFGVRGDREISSVQDAKSKKANVHSMSDVQPKPVESVFNPK